MEFLFLLLTFLTLSVLSYSIGTRQVKKLSNTSQQKPYSIPSFYGYYIVCWTCIPVVTLFCAWLLLKDWIILELTLLSLPPTFIEQTQSLPLLKSQILNLVYGVTINQQTSTPHPLLLQAAQYYQNYLNTSPWLLSILSLLLAASTLFYAKSHVKPQFNARISVEKVVYAIIILCSLTAIVTTLGIFLSLLFESLQFFTHVSLFEFFGTHWSPQIAIRKDQVGATGGFGIVPLLAGTFLITLIALSIAVPLGLMTAIYLSEYASPTFRSWVKPIIEILAGIPTVVYGFFAALVMAPLIQKTFGEQGLGFTVSAGSALAAGIVMGLMILPFISSLVDDILYSMPQALRDGAYGLGSTTSEMVFKIFLPTAFPGIVGAVIMAFGRAVGETMIVTMAAGLTANLTFNPLEAVTTVTTQITTLLVGDQSFDSPKTLAAFALGLTLFLVTFLFNTLGRLIIHRYKLPSD